MHYCHVAVKNRKLITEKRNMGRRKKGKKRK